MKCNRGDLPPPPYGAEAVGLPFPIMDFVKLAVLAGMDAREAECQFRIMAREKGIEICEPCN